MKTTKVRAHISYKQRLNNSVNGNPRYEVGIAIHNNTQWPDAIYGKTATDASFNYGNWEVDCICDVEYHETRSGNVIFDHISEPLRQPTTR